VPLKVRGVKNRVICHTLRWWQQSCNIWQQMEFSEHTDTKR